MPTFDDRNNNQLTNSPSAGTMGSNDKPQDINDLSMPPKGIVPETATHEKNASPDTGNVILNKPMARDVSAYKEAAQKGEQKQQQSQEQEAKRQQDQQNR